MRRRTPGVLSPEEFLDKRLAKFRQYEPKKVIEVLEPFVTDERRIRLREVIARRLSSVTVVFDAPYDPHNGAAVIRSCEAFGVQTLHVIERSRVKFLAATSVARGAERWLNIVRYTEPGDAASAVREAGFELIAADPEGQLEPEDLQSMGKIALVLGNERDGIREEMMAACSRTVRVPMRGFVESLNVSVTAAILLHAATQKRAGDLDPSMQTELLARGLYFTVARADDILSCAASAG